jgi:hypothetical protein
VPWPRRVVPVLVHAGRVFDGAALPAGPGNGQLALAAYKLDRRQGCYLAVALDVLSWQGTRISGTTAFCTPEVFPRFGLPDKLPH